MPPRKRPLIESAQTSAAEPAMKKSTRAIGKENISNEEDTGSSIEKTNDNNNSAVTSSSPATSTASCPLKFVTVPRPMFDIRLERNDDDDEETEDLTEEERKAMQDEANKLFKKPVSDFPEWKWVMSTKAMRLENKYGMQEQKRDQDRFGMYVYNDFTGYGLQEVIENQLLAWTKEFRKKQPNPYELWVMIEAFAYWVNGTEMMYWHMLDDGERVADTCQIIGLAMLSTLNILERAVLGEERVADPEYSSGLVAFLQAWPHQLIAFAKKCEIEIRGVYNIEETLEKYDEEELTTKDKNVVYKKEGADKFGFLSKWKKFVTAYGTSGLIGRATVGGDAYDITKMTKAERKKYAFDHKDPLEEMGPPPAEPDVDAESETENDDSISVE